VATAAGLCYGAIGTDTLGSIRFPSTMNGITGLKPTWGRVSRAGVFALAESLDHVGVMTRSVVDAAAMLKAIAGPDEADPTALRTPVPDYLKNLEQDIRGVRVGIDHELIESNAEAPMAQVTDEAVGVLKGLGADVRAVEFPPVDQVIGDAMKLCAVEAAVAHRVTYPEHREEYGSALAGLIESGLEVDARELAEIWQRRLAFKGRMAGLFEEVDVLLMPAMDTAAPTIASLKEKIVDPEARRRRLLFTTPFTMSGNPCLVLPGGSTQDGMPLGFQMIGRHLDEGLILRVGHAYQRETDWHLRRPGLIA
jgi:amidase